MRRRLREGKEEKFVPPPACPPARPRGMAVGGRREREEVRREIFLRANGREETASEVLN